jgi:hypothetical protein
MGQEVNDQTLIPERNHLLCHFVSSDLNGAAANPQQLINTTLERGGLCFLAHPLERPGYDAAAKTYPWDRWDISDYTGIELWNAMTDVKWQLRSLLRGLIGGYLPHQVLTSPFPEMLIKWDDLLATGRKVVAIGNSDAHALRITWRMITHTFYPYEFLFRAVNTHLFIDRPLDDDFEQARSQIYQALKAGHCYVSYDLIGSPAGFDFIGESGAQQAIMGDTLPLQNVATLRVESPHQAKLRLIKDGKPVIETEGYGFAYRTNEPGVYRVEAYRRYRGKLRGWVFTNPIYVR